MKIISNKSRKDADKYFLSNWLPKWSEEIVKIEYQQAMKEIGNFLKHLQYKFGIIVFRLSMKPLGALGKDEYTEENHFWKTFKELNIPTYFY